jgi:hypothetical protein
MPELAEVVRRFGRAYRARFGDRLLPSHRTAMRAIETCRTPALGGQVWRCDDDGCTEERYAYHSCRNRSCPKCHREQTQAWLALHRARLPACSYVLLTFTVPSELRNLARSHQKAVLGALIRSAAAAVLTLCRDPSHLGAVPAILAVLHTWTRAMVVYHPHVHLLVSLGGVDTAGRWVMPRHADYLVPARALAAVFRGMMTSALRRARLYHHVSRSAWRKDWVVDAQHAGDGEKVLDYLARYVHRVAISNSQIDAITDAGVTFHYRDRKSDTVRSCTLPPLVFLSRFLQHVLPKGFAKVRSYGLLAPRSRPRLDAALAQLAATDRTATRMPAPASPAPVLHRCPICHVGTMRLIRTLPPRRGPP